MTENSFVVRYCGALSVVVQSLFPIWLQPGGPCGFGPVLSDAEATTRKCKEQFHQQQQADDELIASVVLTRTLLAQGKQADAKTEVVASAPLASKNQNRLVGLQFSLASARVALASDQPQPSRPQLEQVIQDAKAHGFLEIEWEAMLSLAELEKKTGHLAAAQSQFASLARDAHMRGLDLIAHKAAAGRD